MIPREQDHRDLSIIRRIIAGEEPTQISKAAGKNDTWARTIFNRTRRADIAESGESRHVVEAGYRRNPS